MITEEKYLALCKACDSLLLEPEISKARVAVPILHVIREHPVFLEKYESLFEDEQSIAGPRGSRLLLHRIKSQFLLILTRSYWWRASHKKNNKSDVLILSHLLNSSHAGREVDFYFGDLPQQLHRHGYTSSIALVNHSGDQDISASGWSQSDIPRYVLSGSLGFFHEASLFLSCFIESLKLNRYKNKPVSSLVKKLAHRASGELIQGMAVYNLRMGKQFERLVRKLDPAAIMITYEGHAWERIVFASARIAKPGIKCWGYQHASLFRLQHGIIRNLAPAYNPDIIFTAGKIGLDHLTAVKELKDTLVKIIGSNRYVNTGEEISKKINNITCLVIPEGIISECVILFEFSIECAKKLPGITFIWRMHPAVSFEQLMGGASIFKDLPSNIILSKQTLEEDFACSRWVLYRGSTAVVQAVSYGLKGIYYGRENEMTIDPFYAFNKSKIQVATSEAFVKTIGNELIKPVIENDIEMAEIRSYCQTFFSPINPFVIEEQLQ